MENDNEPNNTAAETTPENGQPSPPPIPEKRLTKTEELQAQFVAMDKPATLPNTIDALLKKPASVLHDLQNGNFGKVSANLLITALICLGVFGFILGLFSGEKQLWSAPAKVVLGVGISGLITLPSLYIFSCLNGLDVSFKSVAGVLASSLTLVSLLLIGLAPVSWIFTQSTDSKVIVGFLTLVFWTIALGFGLSLIFKAARIMGVKNRAHLAIWALIFTVVTLQMSTSLRPIIGKADTFLPTEKKFFLTHWFDEMSQTAEDTENGVYRR
ncbi:MAG: hypothetical protein ACKVJU_20380 [Verrucomicrobiales bacterium]